MDRSNILSQFTDKELRAELYQRNKKRKKDIDKKRKCLNCKYRICYTKAIAMHNTGLLKYRLPLPFFKQAICGQEGFVSPISEMYMQIYNWEVCDNFEMKTKE